MSGNNPNGKKSCKLKTKKFMRAQGRVWYDIAIGMFSISMEATYNHILHVSCIKSYSSTELT